VLTTKELDICPAANSTSPTAREVPSTTSDLLITPNLKEKGLKKKKDRQSYEMG